MAPATQAGIAPGCGSGIVQALNGGNLSAADELTRTCFKNFGFEPGPKGRKNTIGASPAKAAAAGHMAGTIDGMNLNPPVITRPNRSARFRRPLLNHTPTRVTDSVAVSAACVGSRFHPSSSAGEIFDGLIKPISKTKMTGDGEHGSGWASSSPRHCGETLDVCY